MPVKSASAALLAIVLIFCAIFLLQASAFFALYVPPRNWRQVSLYRRAYARLAPWRLHVGLVMLWVCIALAVVCGLLAASMVEDPRMPVGPASMETISAVVTLLLILGTLSIVISALSHLVAFRSRRLMLRLLAQEDDKLAGQS